MRFAFMILLVVVGLYHPRNMGRYDANRDGVVTAYDASLALRGWSCERPQADVGFDGRVRHGARVGDPSTR